MAMEYYLVLKRNEPSNCEKTWRKLKCMLLSERSQSEKNKKGVKIGKENIQLSFICNTVG